MNEGNETRCVRCGRRLHGASSRSAAAGFGGASVTGAATALALAPETRPEQPPSAQAPPDSGEAQPSLFRDLPGGPKIVPIPMLTPLRPQSPLDRESVRRNAARSAARVPRSIGGAQQPLDFQRPGQIQPRPDESLYCDARVALPAQRVMAAATDGALVVSGTGMFFALAYLGGVEFGIFGNLLLLPAAMTAVVAVLYRGLWCLANRDTPGMRFAGLRLVDFDGRTPRRDRRIVRQFAGLLSLLSAGVGLVWALVDEESLTWHDHISKTFPTTA